MTVYENNKVMRDQNGLRNAYLSLTSPSDTLSQLIFQLFEAFFVPFVSDSFLVFSIVP